MIGGLSVATPRQAVSLQPPTFVGPVAAQYATLGRADAPCGGRRRNDPPDLPAEPTPDPDPHSGGQDHDGLEQVGQRLAPAGRVTTGSHLLDPGWTLRCARLGPPLAPVGVGRGKSAGPDIAHGGLRLRLGRHVVLAVPPVGNRPAAPHEPVVDRHTSHETLGHGTTVAVLVPDLALDLPAGDQVVQRQRGALTAPPRDSVLGRAGLGGLRGVQAVQSNPDTGDFQSCRRRSRRRGRRWARYRRRWPRRPA